MRKVLNSYGLVVCGGDSKRMGQDKGMLAYRNKPQRYLVHDMLSHLCDRTFISCREDQLQDVHPGYPCLPDSPLYKNIGPMAALLTAFHHFPDRDFFFVGCDYPLLTKEELLSFSAFCRDADGAAAFYNPSTRMYDPLLGWYPHEVYPFLLQQFKNSECSLLYFLQTSSARRYQPASFDCMKSIDTPEQQIAVSAFLAQSNTISNKLQAF